MINKDEISALIQLLDDSDNEVFEHVYDKLKTLGKDVIPELEGAWEVSMSPLLHERIEELIHTIQFDSIQDDFKAWVNSEEQSLLDIAILISRFNFPDVDVETINNEIEKVRKDVWLELSYNLPPHQIVNIFNQVFYVNHKFVCNVGKQHYPKDYFASQALLSHKGNTFSIGMLYIIIAHKLDLPIYGVALPRHLALAFCRNDIDLTKPFNESQKEVIFYINSIDGAIFSRNEIKKYLKKLKVEEDTKYYAPASNVEIVKCLLTNLRELYKRNKADVKADEVLKLIDILNAA